MTSMALTTQLLTATSTAFLLAASTATYGSRPTLILNPPAEIPEGLEVGSTVSYDPSGSYNWEAQYSGNDTDQNLSSANGQGYDLNEWRVLSIDEMTGKVELVPTTQTTGTVQVYGAQGYNNWVKLLNEACSSLYGNSSKGIEARSMNIEDIEKYMTTEALGEAHEYANGAKYGEQVGSAYSSGNSYYPAIYEKEKLSVINGNKNTEGIEMSEQESWETGGYKQGSSIQPYQTYWYKNSSFMSTAFEVAENGTSYYSLIMPKGTSSTYWLASRCVNTYSSGCNFNLRFVNGGSVDYVNVVDSYEGEYWSGSCGLFPVVFLSSELISGSSSAGFVVQ